MGSSNKTKGIVDFGDTFLKYYTDSFSDTTVGKVDDFIEHVEANGLSGWVGKVSPSNRVPENYADREAIIDKANKYSLWHAHIGDPCFKDTWHKNYKVSDWVIHFQKISNYHIKLLELDYHNPMTLPSEKILEE
ncbi:hypothetical protein A6D98_03025 [Aliivibrio fischeri]|uniref:hypothetical protein n=1 Tax=Aliivibrio fischeri TaxID=668 RepID=UPI00080E4E26|nr:hypothetical protein [Aliivibrio fischeri]OCH01504.1 hypothetical protein A6E10_18760 [Aliivibrio fischeri]OCH63290.1 hypothetical protein A6D98_03025 [Aliivibrio fischeri]